MTERVVRSLGTGRFLEWKALNACGWLGDFGEWGDLGFYGGLWPFTRLEREWLWEEVGAIRGIWEGPWCLGGDFNITLAQGREQARENSSAMRRFAEVVDDLGLVDLQLQGGIEVRGSASFRLSAKLKELKQKLKVWNREEFGNLESNKEAAIQQVEYWDRVEDERSLSMEE
ncbi:hypothetical protein CK203_029580 [Vitis vinifera]|uniref:Endonuclease/exonuclease/phosphatase domain-containing protein n=1 Tax=Vitis vinifera TaxID=29760 RepID=A0A438JCI4_VITVI|nr:hypothetical protein CK203_029580 [Vitis vinifera]